MERIAMYLRLSKEDESMRDESNSIASQRELIRSYIHQQQELQDLEVIELKDDGYSGKNLERPGMQHLLDLVRKQQVSCIIVKDFSRFSRDYLVIGQYTEQIFPFMGIRFISINDHYDSANTDGGVGEIDMAFRELLYDFYSEDLSQKVRSSIHARKEKGYFMNVFAPYGYQKTGDGTYSLKIEPKGAEVVRTIFQRYADGMSMYAVAKSLNQDKIPCPRNYIMERDGRDYFRHDYEDCYWTTTAVSRVLHNETYLGNVIYGKAKNPEVGAPHSVPIPKEDWNRKAGMHEPIISEELWNKVHRRMKPVKQPKKKYESHVLAGLVICGGCGRRMQQSMKGKPKFTCNHQHFQKSEDCVKSIRQEDLDRVILSLVQEKIQKQISLKEAVADQSLQKQERLQTSRQKLRSMEASRERMEADLLQAYESYRTGITGRETYLQQRSLYEEMLETLKENLEKQREAVRRIEEKETAPKTWIAEEEYLQITSLDRFLAELLIDKVIVYNDKRIEVHWNMKKE